MKSLTEEVKQNLLKFKIGTLVESQSGEYIGHVVGYHMHENRYYWESPEIQVRWFYQLRVMWSSQSQSIVSYEGQEEISDFNDVRIIE